MIFDAQHFRLQTELCLSPLWTAALVETAAKSDHCVFFNVY